MRLDHLGSDVLRGPAGRLEDGLVLQLAESHVRDLDHGLTVVNRTEQNVLGLEVAMTNVLKTENQTSYRPGNNLP